MSSCRFRTVLRTRVLQANGSHRIMDKSLVGEPKKDYNHATLLMILEGKLYLRLVLLKAMMEEVFHI